MSQRSFIEDSEDEEYVDVIFNDLTPIQKLRLLWDEYIVAHGRATQALVLLASTVTVLALWLWIQAGPLPPPFHPGDVFDDRPPPGAPTDWSQLRLPAHVVPIRYGIDIWTDLELSRFNGSVVAKLNLTQSSHIVVVHSVGLYVPLQSIRIKTEVERLESVEVTPNNIRIDVENEYLVIQFDRALRRGIWDLVVSFEGNLTNSLAGFYRSSYQTEAGESRALAVTQFCPTDARRAFPCLDEPGMKAVFQLNMTVVDTLNAFSNTPVVEQVVTEEGLKHIAFEETPRMSTYLVAFIVSDFERVTGKTNSGVEVGVIAAPDRINRAKTALKYGIKYPLGKIDLVAVPELSFGAMENWGLVMYKEDTLLENDKVSMEESDQGIASIVAHELAHQWFGNLVTMKWWTDIWLNEGFATFMTSKALSAIEPTWRHQELFFASETSNALTIDASEYTHPIVNNITRPSEIYEVFDAVSYDKGASLIRMVEGWLDDVAGPGYFMEQIRGYLEHFKYQNADTKQLWEALGKESLNITDVMKNWTERAWLSLLSLSGDSVGSGFTVLQERFYADGRVGPSGQFWQIPLKVYTYTRAGVRVGGAWMQMMKGNQTIKLVDEDHVFLVNPGRRGFYRVAYPEWVWSLFADWSEAGLLAKVDVAGLISDSFALSFSGNIKDPAIPLSFLASLPSETEHVVWKSALSELKKVTAILSIDSSYGLWEVYLRRLLDPIVQSLGWIETSANKRDHHTRALLRSELLEFALSIGNTTISTHLTGLVYNAGILFGDESDFEFIMNLYEKAVLASEKKLLQSALVLATRSHQVAALLEYALAPNHPREDMIDWLIGLASGSHHMTVWTFMKERWSDIVEIWRRGAGTEETVNWSKVNNFIGTLISSFVESSAIDEAQQLFLKAGGGEGWFVPPGADGAVRRGLERARINVKWVKLNGKLIKDWLKSH
ncbi:hypothetical protein BCR33DRAFT_718578 [Rhizoclosmatium globosum]|uniref:Aminopeptidase n=1 Tax=Rhizoclosmatium globosum TaxID=329046 RepID=A0A1Y2C4V6_9FUNG|nr:hypothetical protein BCR33DRAFT_718578 [Rhizoclosmatium globosum]|eukprot:ORY41927.1 hypothetical protein BCR33DRAFT_718578 [Rhizoclosmatium globosum]